MKKLLLLTTIIAINGSIFAQSNIKINGSAPKINITDWVLNKPADTNLEDKFIVLEFWATWCGPCIAAVPHMNELQDAVKQDDLYFISITDESVKKINRVIDRIPFQSIVATDISKETQINFGDGKEGLEAYPMTVLIDNKGKVKWVGEPMQLNEDILRKFLSGDLKGKNYLKKINQKAEKEEKKSEKNQPKGLTSKDFMEILKDKTKPYQFEIEETRLEGGDVMQVGNKALFFSGASLKDIFDKAFNKNIELYPELATQRYNLIYKNLNPDAASLQQLEDKIILALSLKKEVKSEKLSLNAVRIKDVNLLKPALEPGFSARSEADDKILFSGFTIGSLIKEINKLSQAQYQFDEESTEKYDFIIEVNSDAEMAESLKSYGLAWEPIEKELEIMYLKR